MAETCRSEKTKHCMVVEKKSSVLIPFVFKVKKKKNAGLQCHELYWKFDWTYATDFKYNLLF